MIEGQQQIEESLRARLANFPEDLVEGERQRLAIIEDDNDLLAVLEASNDEITLIMGALLFIERNNALTLQTMDLIRRG
jgi:hypothetical protein